jgi:hypothetical protein
MLDCSNNPTENSVQFYERASFLSRTYGIRAQRQLGPTSHRLTEPTNVPPRTGKANYAQGQCQKQGPVNFVCSQRKTAEISLKFLHACMSGGSNLHIMGHMSVILNTGGALPNCTSSERILHREAYMRFLKAYWAKLAKYLTKRKKVRTNVKRNGTRVSIFRFSR